MAGNYAPRTNASGNRQKKIIIPFEWLDAISIDEQNTKL